MSNRTTPTLYPRPKPGDVVLCHFPQNLALPLPGPKPRPALILAASELERGGYDVTVCYGTSQAHRSYPWDFILDPIDNPSAFKRTGLVKRTRFDLSQLVTLSYDSTWFLVPELKPYGLTPRLGELQADVVPDLMKAIQAAKRK
ncbi:MAG: hypothetical protein JWQ90_5488 [Hydrocarboniphaga sp.]|uniref:type II toxin-antitoxin system PemK/MazF family toxin n=1 Tax=Hydrocarboniphaga sp. TaxID=2033016 RepID=UPI0026160066|nr:type II toxin-antitoxin system PemK/MazF family toxin [Hydrocarboniphaga sp.]MDB5973038.1 hypothetical protein [Hydrocarboniphaga sp.]